LTYGHSWSPFVDFVTSNHNFVTLSLAGYILSTWSHPKTICHSGTSWSHFAKLVTAVQTRQYEVWVHIVLMAVILRAKLSLCQRISKKYQNISQIMILSRHNFDKEKCLNFVRKLEEFCRKIVRIVKRTVRIFTKNCQNFVNKVSEFVCPNFVTRARVCDKCVFSPCVTLATAGSLFSPWPKSSVNFLQQCLNLRQQCPKNRCKKARSENGRSRTKLPLKIENKNRLKRQSRIW
jgi:hypothetical protein